MRIALCGYGKMGKAIEKIALDKGHDISARIDSSGNWEDINSDNTDVVIEFSTPEAVLKNIDICFEKDIPVVVGTTGWHDRLEEVRQKAVAGNRALLYASNFSIGVNLFFELNKWLAKLMSEYRDYSASMSETHHIHKLDAPSGTAITLAQQILENHQAYNKWVKGKSDGSGSLGIESHRIDEVPGTHNITYASDIDEIFIEHRAKSRLGFAMGAVFAAEWLKSRKGFFNIPEALGL